MPVLAQLSFLMKAQQTQVDRYLSDVKSVLPNLVVCEIDEQVGKGIFWKGPETIKKGTAVTCYAGLMSAALSEATPFSGYGYSVPAHPLFKNYSEGAMGVLQGLQGNHSRFMQHLPEAKRLEQFKLSPSVEIKNIATANVEALNMLKNGIPLVVFVATEDIPPNAQIGFDYGDSYWAQAYYYLQIKPLLFNKQGKTLEPSQYEKLVINLKVGTETVIRPLKDIMLCLLKQQEFVIINAHSLKEIVISPIELTNRVLEEIASQNPAPNSIHFHFSNWIIKTDEARNAKDYQTKFINLIHSILLKHLLSNTFDDKPAAKVKIPYIERLVYTLDQSMNANTVFITVKKMLDYAEDKEFYAKNLLEMRREIISAMKEYNSDILASKRPLQTSSQDPKDISTRSLNCS